MPVSMSFRIYLVSGGISAITSSFHASGNTRNRSRYGTAVVRPRSRGYLRVARPNPTDTIEIVANTLAGSADMKALIRAIELYREIGNSSAMSRFAKREVMPGNLTAGELENFARNAASAFWHQACTAKMGRDEMS